MLILYAHQRAEEASGCWWGSIHHGQHQTSGKRLAAMKA
jgi:hypothetical protein